MERHKEIQNFLWSSFSPKRRSSWGVTLRSQLRCQSSISIKKITGNRWEKKNSRKIFKWSRIKPFRISHSNVGWFYWRTRFNKSKRKKFSFEIKFKTKSRANSWIIFQNMEWETNAWQRITINKRQMENVIMILIKAIVRWLILWLFPTLFKSILIYGIRPTIQRKTNIQLS